MNCKYLRKRIKKYKMYFYCTNLKKEVNFNDCSICNRIEYKINKPLKKISKKRIFVSKNTYNIVLRKCNYQCQICNTTKDLHYHHILYRSERKDLIDVPSNGIMLCEKCHRLVHSNKKYWQPILIDKEKNLKK